MNGLELSSPEQRAVIERVAELALNYFETLAARPLAPRVAGSDTLRLFAAELPEQGLGLEALDALGEVIRASRAQHGGFFGYVLGSGEPVAAAADLLASALNQNVTAWRSAPAATAIERTVVSWLAEAVGCRGYSGSLTGGGSSANLMGLAMAREALAPANETGARPGIVYAPTEVHMSIPKAVALLGLGRENLRLVPVDENFRMAPEELDRAIRRDLERRKRPLAVVASAGTVNTGAIDPLEAIATVSRRHGLWLHVDGAYGALAAITAPEKFAGLALADSLSLDPHKWLYQPLDCGCLLYRDPAAARRAFSHSGDYARPLGADPVEGFAFFDESMELSRRFRALKLWLSLRYHGLERFRQAIRADLEHARALAERIRNEPRLELLATGDLSVVCFRSAGEKRGAAGPAGEEELDRLNAAVLKRVIERGRVYLSNANLGGRFALRACIVNHRTTERDIEAVVQETLSAAREIGGSSETGG
jgi:aromatic-L-amino-acid/L-tryptophan decarboxylase